MPLPALPEALLTPVLSRVIRLVASVTLVVGVRIAVQVMPPSPLVTVLRVPLATVRSALVKPVTASLKVMVTNELAPILRAGFPTMMVAVGRTVSMVKLPELVIPVPALPARSLTPALLRLIRLVVSWTPAVGVKVAVQVIPPSLLLTVLRMPLATLRSLLSNPVTASLKVIVTSEVSPALNTGSATTMLAVGRTLSSA